MLVADTGYGANADFRRSLEDCGLAYVLQTKAEMTAHGEEAAPHQPDYRGLGPRPLPRYCTTPYSLREHVLTAGRNSGQTLTWRKGSKAAITDLFGMLSVRVTGGDPCGRPVVCATHRAAD